MNAAATPVTTFVFNLKHIRVVTLEGDPWFSLRDVSECLGWTPDNAKYHAKFNLDQMEKRVVKLPGSRGAGSILIAESGLYKLIMRSDKENAKPFQDWVTQEVLPSIRRTGAFVKGQPSIKENPEMDPLDLMMAQAELIPKLIAEMRESRRIAQEQAKVIEAQAVAITEVKKEVTEILEQASVYDFNRTYKLKLSLGDRTRLGKKASERTRAAGKLIKTKAFDGQATYPVKFLLQAAKELKFLK